MLNIFTYDEETVRIGVIGFPIIGLNYTWIAFPIAETSTGLVGLIMYIILMRDWKKEDKISGNVC